MPRIPRLICALAAVAVFAGCAGTGNPLVGSWRLVSSGDEAAAPGAEAKATIKILNDSHFAFGAMTPAGAVYGGGGRYEYSNGIYTEMPEYHSYRSFIGRQLSFRCELKGDLWYHSGSFEVAGRPVNVKEVWKRIEGEGAPPRDDRVARGPGR